MSYFYTAVIFNNQLLSSGCYSHRATNSVDTFVEKSFSHAVRLLFEIIVNLLLSVTQCTVYVLSVLGTIWNQVISNHDLKSFFLNCDFDLKSFYNTRFWFWFQINFRVILMILIAKKIKITMCQICQHFVFHVYVNAVRMLQLEWFNCLLSLQ